MAFKSYLTIIILGFVSIIIYMITFVEKIVYVVGSLLLAAGAVFVYGVVALALILISLFYYIHKKIVLNREKKDKI